MSLETLIAAGETAVASISDFRKALPIIEKIVSAVKNNTPISLTGDEAMILEIAANDIVKVGNDLASAVEDAKLPSNSTAA